MGDVLSLSYNDVEEQCVILDQVVSDFNNDKERMSRAVNVLCDGWKSDTSEKTRDNYNALKTSLDETVNIVEELKVGIRQYVADMQELDNAHAARTVTY